jgi:hypothetical protein
MSKIPSIIFLLFVSTVLFAQEVEIISKEVIPVEKEVVDLFVATNSTFLLTKEGEILEFTSDRRVTVIGTNGLEAFYELKVNTKFQKDFDVNSYLYLIKFQNSYYACFYDGSYSSRIVKINPSTFKEDFFCFLEFKPSGMYPFDGKLWYLGNRTPGPGRSRIICYDINDKSLLFFSDVSILDAKGLAIDDKGVFTTYENQSHSLIKFKIKIGE